MDKIRKLKNWKRNQNLHFTQTINQTFSIFNSYKSWKKFILTKAQSPTKLISFTQHRKIAKMFSNNLINLL